MSLLAHHILLLPSPSLQNLKGRAEGWFWTMLAGDGLQRIRPSPSIQKR